MNWRNIIVGALLTLIVTVIGGILATILTRPPTLAEHLVYTIDPPVTFDAQDTKISLISAKITNLGTATANDVVVNLKLPDVMSIVEHRTQMSSGPAAKYHTMAEKNQITVDLDHLVPKETLTISAMLDGIADKPPLVSVRSESSMGEPGLPLEDNGKEPYPLLRDVSLAMLSASWFGAMIWIWRSRRFEITKSVNNLAFLYIHQGLVEEAEQILCDYMGKKGATIYEIANYALALSLNGKTEQAQKLFAIGDRMAKRRYVRGLVEFNKCVAALGLTNFAQAREHLTKALALSPRQISEYCQFSVHIRAAVRNDLGLARIVGLEKRTSEVHA